MLIKGKFRVAFFIFLLAFILFFPPASKLHGAQVTLAWDASTDPNVVGYKIHYGTASGNYPAEVKVGNKTTCIITNLTAGTTYYFAATGYDSSGQESGYSNEVVYPPPSACTFSLSPGSYSSSASGGARTVQVATQSGCAWTATSNVSWLIITSNSARTGSGTVNYSISANSSAASRSGTMTIAGKVFNVSQSGSGNSCSYAISPTSKSFTAGGGTGTVNVTAGNGCPWNSSSNASWISILSGGSRTGNGTVSYSVSPNPNGTSRTGTISLAGKILTVSQTGASTFTLEGYTITALAGANGSISPSGTVAVGYGASQTFTIRPYRGYRIVDVKVDGVSVGSPSTFSFGNVRSNHTIEANFAPLYRSYWR